jgi:hypothetical protein
MHGQGQVPSGSYSSIHVEVPAYSPAGGDYVFFDIWYEGADRMRVQVV